MPENLVDLRLLPLALLAALSFFFLLQMMYYLIVFIRLARYRRPAVTGPGKGVSVVICAHNEYYNLKANLPLVLEQDYPEFEVLVVNHASEDETAYLLADLQRVYPRLKSIEIREDLNFFSGKKFPLAIGIRSARYDHLLLTDADCRPSSPAWISAMQSVYNDRTRIVLGYGAYSKEKGLLNKLIRFDTAHIATQFLSYALAGIPYMGVGRNLSYHKSVFYDNKGFIPHYRIQSGDDDLFINSVARKSNVAVVVDPSCLTFSEPKKTFSKWIRQKGRHLSTSRHYRFIHKLLLGMYSFSIIAFYALAVVMLSLGCSVIPVAGMLATRLAVQYLVLTPCFRKLGEKDLVLYIPLMEIVLLFVNAGTGISNLFRRQNKWK